MNDIKTLTDIKSYYWDQWNDIKSNNFKKLTAWESMDQVTQITDDIIGIIIDYLNAPIDGLTIIALGGYARKQMAPYSDIDILILHHGNLKPKQEEFINTFITTLWDIGAHPGIQMKDIEELEKAALEDEVVKTSFVDNRFLSGDKSLYIEFQNILYNRIMTRGKSEFLLKKISEVRTRAKKFRDSVFRLEPNIKEGRGGLRDINSVYWICNILFNTDNLAILVQNGIITLDDYDRFVRKSEILFSIRNRLHYYHNRLNNVLNMEAQQYIAKEMGYMNTSNILAVELFMKDYYKAARKIMEITNKVINITMTEQIAKSPHSKIRISDLGNGFFQYGNQLSVQDVNLFKNKPGKLISIFTTAANYGLQLSDATMDLIHDNIYLLTPDEVKKLGYQFLKAIGSFPNSFKITTTLFQTGVLLKFIPEFSELICKAQFDLYHHYTVDEHTILALKFIDNLSLPQPPQFQNYQKVFSKVPRKDLLALSIMLHDIGKGQGKNHSIVGAKMAKVIGKRMGMKRDDIDIVSNMVEQHLLMSHISQRRDLHDIEVIHHFTSFLESKLELKLLYLLTYADMNAVGGEAFNQWRNTLLTELYNKSAAAFDNENLLEEFQDVVRIKRQKTLERITKDTQLKKIMEMLDDDYLYSTKVSHVVRHLKMAASLSENQQVRIESEIRPELNCIEFTICTYDFIGLFRKLAGALSAMGLNILGAQIYTFGSNIAVDTIQVSSKDDNVDKLSEKLPEYMAAIAKIIAEKKKVRDMFKSLTAPSDTKNSIIQISKKVIIDNEVSSQYTVVDVYTEDKVNLLYNLLGGFKKMRLNVQKAKISTDVDRVVDSFYITNRKNEKIVDEEMLEKIKTTILEMA